MTDQIEAGEPTELQTERDRQLQDDLGEAIENERQSEYVGEQRTEPFEVEEVLDHL